MIEQWNEGCENHNEIRNSLILSEEKTNVLNAEIKYLKLKISILRGKL